MHAPSSLAVSRRALLAALAGAGVAAGCRSVEPGSEPSAGAPFAAVSGPIRVDLNESPWGPSPRVAAALRDAGPLWRYVGTEAERLVQAIAEHERIDAAHVVLGDVIPALGRHLAARAGAGARLLHADPGHTGLVDGARPLGGIGVPTPLSTAHRHDLAAFAAAIDARTAAVYLVNPHNPSGTFEPDRDVRAFATEHAARALVVVNEVYLDYVDDAARRSVVDLVGAGLNVAVIRTFSKAHGLAGLPLEYALLPRALADTLRAEGVGHPRSLALPAVIAATAAITDTDHVRAVRAAVARERAQWHAWIDARGLPRSAATASFVFFDVGRPHAGPAAALAARGVRIGRVFPPYSSWLRITIGTTEENVRVRRALEAVLADAA